MPQENELLAQRRANMEALAALGVDLYPARVRAHGHRRRSWSARTARRRRPSSRPSGSTRGRAAGFWRSAASARPTSWCSATGVPASRSTPRGLAAGARLQDVHAARSRRLRRRVGPPVPDPDRRVHHLGRLAHVPREVPDPAAREVARPPGHRDPVPPALPRPDRDARNRPRLRGAKPHAGGHARLPQRARLSRGRDADDAAAGGRRAGAAVRDASQRARHDALPPHRARAVPQAPAGRRHGARLRDQPQLPQRGDLDAAQPRVHDARVLPGLQQLPRADDDDRGDAGGRGARR